MIEDFTFLEGFDRRMQFVAMAEAIVRRSGRDMDLERLFEPQEMDSLMMAVLVFVMEETLAENRECTLDRIEQFLGKLLRNVKPSFPIDLLRDISNYIVKTVLKNDGEPRYYTLLHPDKGFQKVKIDFLADIKRDTSTSYQIHYQLTDQAYEFLFRTKEVENELRFTMEELKLRELIRRKNYGKAASQSTALIQMIRQKKRELQQFLERVRDNVLTVDIGEFEALYRSTFDLLAEEYGIMREIREMLQLAYTHLKEEELRQGSLDREMVKAMSEMERIRRNIDVAVSEQQAMILERHTVSAMYNDIMQDAFSRRLLNRFDLEEEILKPMMRADEQQMNRLFRLLNPLFLSEMPKSLGIPAIYAPQAKLKQLEEQASGVVFEGLEADMEAQKIKDLNRFHLQLTDHLLRFASLHPDGFRLSNFKEALEKGELLQRSPDKGTLFQMVMRLYEAEQIDVAAWRAERAEVADNATGEFDLAYCLYRVAAGQPDLYGVRRLLISWPDGAVLEMTTRMQHNGAVFESKTTVSDFYFSVELEKQM